VAGPAALCLKDGRFRVTVSWRVPSQNRSGSGQAVSLGSESGYFWFYSAGTIELAVKIVDGRAFNDRFWFFCGGLTDAEYTIEVTDTLTGASKTYLNPAGRVSSVADTSAF
jgi:hypothetical protein